MILGHMVIGLRQVGVSSGNLVPSPSTENHLLSLRASRSKISTFGKFAKKHFLSYFANVQDCSSHLTICQERSNSVGLKFRSLDTYWTKLQSCYRKYFLDMWSIYNHLLSLRASRSKISTFGKFAKKHFLSYFANVQDCSSHLTICQERSNSVGLKFRSLDTYWTKLQSCYRKYFLDMWSIYSHVR